MTPRGTVRIDRVISLGGDCEVAAQARRASGSDRAYPFDWWTTPLESVPRLLTSRFRHVFEVEYLSKRQDVIPVLDSSYGLTSHIHEFRHGEDFLSYDMEAISRRLTEKYRFLSARFFEDCSRGTTLFIRRNVHYDPADRERLERSVSEIRDILGQVCPSFYLLLTGYEPGLSTCERVLQRNVTRYDDAKHLGSDRGWDEMLATLPFSFVRQGNSPGMIDLTSTARPPLSRLERLSWKWREQLLSLAVRVRRRRAS
jgi:hypothetical protein